MPFNRSSQVSYSPIALFLSRNLITFWFKLINSRPLSSRIPENHLPQTGLWNAPAASVGPACCGQTIEFELGGKHSFPEDYPDPGTDVTVIGVFNTYEEHGYTYCTLRNAELVAKTV